MAKGLGSHIRTIGWYLVGIGCFLSPLACSPSEATSGMPADQRAYWSWVGSINEGGSSALASGIALLEEMPHLPALYLRLAEVCLEEDAVATCQEAYGQVQPPDSLTRLYREAALARLNTQTEADTTGRYWLPIARDAHLDPTLARLIVDAGTMQNHDWLDAAEGAWRDVLAADSSKAGAAFGLGYAAVRRYEWDSGEQLLQHVTELLPKDSQAYRELGRIYYTTGQRNELEAVLEKGILAARGQYDLDAELTLSGNLGWSLFLSDGDLKKAEGFLEEALNQSRILSKRRSEGINLYRLANLYTRQYSYDKALTLLDSADVIYVDYMPDRRSEVMVLQGDILSRIYRFHEADSLLKLSIVEAENHQRRDEKVQALSSLTALQYEMGQYAAARTTGLQALALSKTNKLKSSEMRARMFLGDVERRLGNFEAALDHFEHGLVLAKESQSINAQSLTSRLGRIALSLEDAATAKKRFEDLLKTAQEMHVSNLARAYRGLGDAYMQFENTTEAIAYYNKALQQLPEHEYEEIRQGVLRAKAYAMLEAALPDSAIALFQEIQRTGRGSSGQAYFLESGLGQAYLNKQLFEIALQHFQRADAIEQEVSRPSVHWNVLFGEALAYWHLDQLAAAEGAFREAIGLIEAIRENLDSSERRASYTQGKGRVYEYFAAFLEAQGREIEALAYTERARSRSLLDLLYTVQRSEERNSETPVGRLIELNRQLGALADDLEEEAVVQESSPYASERVAQLRREYARADSIYLQVEGQLSAEEQIYTFNPLSPDAMQRTLKEGEAMVIFDLREGSPAHEAVTSVAYVVLPNSIHTYPLDVEPESLAETIRFFRDHIGTTQPGERWEPIARRLYRDLMKPLLETLPHDVEHLHIIPEGVLHYIPFAALQDEKEQFLVEQFSLSVAPSASILSLSQQQSPKQWQSMLLLGDPDGRLPGSRDEVLGIAGSEAGKHKEVLLGTAATKAAVTQLAPTADIIHFATHGRFVKQDPARSHLELHGEEVLSVEEIRQLKFQAYLVTLSACETALSGGRTSDVPDGDEWIGFNQAFLAAGTATVMTSLWPIDDHVSSTFMIDFYETLRSMGKAHALAEVQRRFIHDENISHPFYWASFTMVGAPL